MITDNYFIHGPLDGVRNSDKILGDYYEYLTFDPTIAKRFDGMEVVDMNEKIRTRAHLYQRHYTFPYIFIYQGEGDIPGTVKIHKDVVMKAIKNFFGSEYLYALRSARSEVLYKKAAQLMVEADEYYDQARYAEEWVYCDEKLRDIVKEYGEIK